MDNTSLPSPLDNEEEWNSNAIAITVRILTTPSPLFRSRRISSWMHRKEKGETEWPFILNQCRPVCWRGKAQAGFGGHVLFSLMCANDLVLIKDSYVGVCETGLIVTSHQHVPRAREKKHWSWSSTACLISEGLYHMNSDSMTRCWKTTGETPSRITAQSSQMSLWPKHLWEQKT